MAALTSFPMPAARAARVDRYLRLVHWARRRYDRDGLLLIRRAGGIPSRYTLIEDAAAAKLLGSHRRYAPGTTPARES